MRKLLFIFLLAVLIIPACRKAQETPAAPVRATVTPIPPRPTPNSAELELSDPAEIIEVSTGNQFTITVKTNLSAEYHWGLDQALDSEIVEYVWKDNVPDVPGDPNASGRDVWRFVAIAPGKTTIILGYYRGLTIQATQKPVFSIVVK